MLGAKRPLLFFAKEGDDINIEDTAEEIIKKYVDDFLFRPKASWPDSKFRERSYKRTAVSLLLEDIKNNPDKDIKWVISSFSLKMDRLYEDFFDKPFADRFLYAREVSREIYYLFC